MTHRPDVQAKAKTGPSPAQAGLWAGLHLGAIVILFALAMGIARADGATVVFTGGVENLVAVVEG